jgi:hypothetical protein
MVFQIAKLTEDLLSNGFDPRHDVTLARTDTD